MRAPVIARLALICGLAGAAWGALSALDSDTARADDRPAATTERPGGVLEAVADVVDQVVPKPTRPAEPEVEATKDPEPEHSEEAAPEPEPEQADEPADTDEQDAPADEPTTEPRTPDKPVIHLPPIEVPVDVPPVVVDLPPVIVDVPPVVIDVPPIVVDVPPVVTPPVVVVALPPVVTPPTTTTPTPERTANGDQPAATGTTGETVTTPAPAAAPTPAGLPVLIGPLPGRGTQITDDAIRPAGGPAPLPADLCDTHRSIGDVRRDAGDAARAERLRDASRVDDPSPGRPCPGSPTTPTVDTAGMAAVTSGSPQAGHQLLGDALWTLTWRALARLDALRARSAIPAGRLTHLDPRPA